MKMIRYCCVAALVLLMGITSIRAGDEAPRREPPAGGPHVPESLEMLGSILLHGAEMGPGSGWFHPAEKCYDWSWLAARFDHDGDGFIRPSDLPGADDRFAHLDRDGDGSVQANDLDWSPGAPFLRRRAQARSQFAQIDADSNGKLSREEWSAYFERLSRDKSYLSQDDLAAMLSGHPPRPPRPAAPADSKPPASPPPSAGMPSRWTLLKGLFQGEIGSPFEGPHVGEMAPDFTLRTREGVPVTLSEFRGHKPVVLIFGSFT